MHVVRQCKRKSGALVVKIELAKVDDNVDWRFLMDTLTAFGFQTKFIHLLMKCVTSASFFVLWNSERLPSF